MGIPQKSLSSSPRQFERSFPLRIWSRKQLYSASFALILVWHSISWRRKCFARARFLSSIVCSTRLCRTCRWWLLAQGSPSIRWQSHGVVTCGTKLKRRKHSRESDPSSDPSPDSARPGPSKESIVSCEDDSDLIGVLLSSLAALIMFRKLFQAVDVSNGPRRPTEEEMCFIISCVFTLTSSSMYWKQCPRAVNSRKLLFCAFHNGSNAW